MIKWITEIWITICDDLRDLVPFVQLKKRKKHPWTSVAFSKVADRKRNCTMVQNRAKHHIYLKFLTVLNAYLKNDSTASNILLLSPTRDGCYKCIYLVYEVNMSTCSMTLLINAWKESVFRVNRIWSQYPEILRFSLYSVRMRENADQNNSEHGHFLRSVSGLDKQKLISLD